MLARGDLGYVIRGIGDIALGLVVGLPWALVILFIYGLNTSTGMVASHTIAVWS